MKTKNFLFMVLLFAFSNSVNAQHPKPKKLHQKARVADGVKDSSLTKKEVAKIREEHQEAKDEAREAREDGVVTDAEKKKINQERKEASRAIRKTKRNNTSRG